MDLVAMMDGSTGGSVLLSLTLIGFAVWLQRNENFGSSNERADCDVTELDRDYLSARSRSRKRTNRLIGTSGLLILATAFMGHPIAWMSTWLIVMTCLLVVIGLAGKDAIRTHRYHRAKLDDVRRML